jgi:3-hydroxyisobutyrate dehydrogenase
MEIKKETTIVGFIGLGVMGHSMAGHILDAGFKLNVYNRTPSKADDLVKKGAVLEASAADLAKKSDVIIAIVGFPADVQEVFLGADGVLANARPGSMAIDMTTSEPALAATLHDKGKQRGVSVLDAPVSGGDLGAKNATLSIMVGGDPSDFEMALPLFKILGKNIVYQGKPGSGQHTKMANQIAIAGGMVAVCESLAYAEKAGLDPQTVLESIGQGAAGSWSLNNMGPRIINRDDQPGFFIKHFIKDMGIATASSKRMGLETPGLDLALALYRKMADRGLENNGTQALYKLFQ